MIGRLNHVAIAVRDLAKAAGVYRDVLGAEVSEAVPQPEHGVTTVFITLPNTKIELIAPLGDNSPIAKFLERSPDGGVHHVCYEVDDILAARAALLRQRMRWLRPAGRRALLLGGPLRAVSSRSRRLLRNQRPVAVRRIEIPDPPSNPSTQ